ncbi:MAG: SDR family NAD(P)-dependent oxidoreductase [Elusimicrobiales bacterium]|jgi:dTDP-glucose 4,6-dehydratase|nr:SDR family NAD(P)-dependent oxidoreductase [Elusimicrobiales bacterium]
MNWRGRKVLITGGSGFIGSHLAERLVRLGARVTALLEYTPYNDLGALKHAPRQVLSQIEFVPGDLRDPEMVKKLLKKKDVVFHLGALVGIPYSYVNPREVFEVNALGTLNVLLAARDAGASKVVTTSTSEVYGTALYTPIDEKHPLQAQSPYSASKIAADKIAESFNRTYGLPVAVIRPFNTYGPRQSDRAIIPTIIAQALTKRTVKLGALAPRRDLNYVADTVEGFILTAESPRSVGRVINIGTGRDISVGELAAEILRLMGRKVKIETTSARKRPKGSEVMQLLCDNSLAAELIGWKPRTTLESGLKQTIDWIKSHSEGYSPDKYNI